MSGKTRLAKIGILAAALIALASAGYYLATAGTLESPVLTREAIGRGLVFLSQVNVTADTLSPAEQAYPGEEMYENLSELALYRKMDFALDLHFIGEELNDAGAARARAAEADEFLQRLALRWQDGPVDYAYFDSGGQKGDFAYDLYCMVSLETGNAKMAGKIRSALGENGWSTPKAQKFREIIDESWCIMMLADNAEPAATLERLIAAKKAQLQAYSSRPGGEGGEVERMRTSYANTHVLMALQYMKEKGYGVSAESEYIKTLQEKAFADAAANADSPDYSCNSLYFLAKSGYPAGKLAPLARNLVAMQGADGGWKSKLSPESFRGLLTARAVLALNAYSQAVDGK
ncbi:MAG: hypothetical protein V1708_03835 [Candidatus Micrarchaeota archaeon]